MSNLEKNLALLAGVLLLALAPRLAGQESEKPRPPNIFIAISDDQSWPHASAYGSRMVSTPAFDRVAREGVLFTQAFCPSPGCSPSRAAFLTGRHTWQIEHAGTHASAFHPRFETFPDRLEASGYFVGSTGKAWGPGNFRHLGREHNPAGRSYPHRKPAGKWKSYSAGLRRFLDARPDDRPFCFWFGSSDPHRGYRARSGLESGKKLEQAEVPGYLPDVPGVRSDLLDYAFEVERFDSDLHQMLSLLEEEGELDRTLVIVTSDNGMPFPRAKANCYDSGIHVPLAVRWGSRIPPGRVVEDLVSHLDLTATIYEAAGVSPPDGRPLAGRSLLDLLRSARQGLTDPSRSAVYAARERHSSSRYNTLGYPQRVMRTHRYLLVKNLTPERWPAGPSRKYTRPVYGPDGKLVGGELGPPHGAYHDIDACPTLDILIEGAADPTIRPFLALSVDRRPAVELFDIVRDPDCLENLAGRESHAEVLERLSRQLERTLRETEDPRSRGQGDVWETYPRFSPLRWFPVPDWAREHPERVPDQPWLEARRPRQK